MGYKAVLTHCFCNRLDKTKFVVFGAGLFSVQSPKATVQCLLPGLAIALPALRCRVGSRVFITVSSAIQGVTLCLFPLSVIKTRQMAVQGAPPGLSVRSRLPGDK